MRGGICLDVIKDRQSSCSKLACNKSQAAECGSIREVNFASVCAITAAMSAGLNATTLLYTLALSMVSAAIFN